MRRFELILENATRVAKTLTPPTYTPQDFEAAMLDIAKREAKPGERETDAFARLCRSGDVRMDALYTAARMSECPPSNPAEGNTYGKRSAGEQKKMIIALLADFAKMHKRGSESQEQAEARLLSTHPVCQDAYALLCELDK